MHELTVGGVLSCHCPRTRGEWRQYDSEPRDLAAGQDVPTDPHSSPPLVSAGEGKGHEEVCGEGVGEGLGVWEGLRDGIRGGAKGCGEGLGEGCVCPVLLSYIGLF